MQEVLLTTQGAEAEENASKQRHAAMVEALDEEKQAALERVAKLELELQMAVMEAQAERNATHGLHDGIKRLHKHLSGGDGTLTGLEFQQRLQLVMSPPSKLWWRRKKPSCCRRK